MQLMIKFCVLTFLFSTLVLAQEAVPRLTRNSSASLGASFEYWASGEHQISEWVLPVAVHYSVSDRLSITLINQPTIARLKRPAQDFNLSGLTDTRLGASFLFGGEKFLATAGANFPTGKTELDQDQLVVAQVIPLRELGLRTNYFGGGLDLSAGLSAALPFGNWVIGAGVGFLRMGAYTPIAGSGKYDPGEEMTFTLGLDRSFGEETKLLADVTYSLYTADTFEGADYFQSGPRLIIEARGYFPLKALDMSIMVRERLKAANQSLQAQPSSNILKLQQEAANSHGNELEVAVQCAYALSERTGIDGLLQAKIYGTNELGTNGAAIFAAGGGWRRKLSSVLRLELGATFSYGSLKDESGSSAIAGFEFHSGMIYNF